VPAQNSSAPEGVLAAEPSSAGVRAPGQAAFCRETKCVSLMKKISCILVFFVSNHWRGGSACGKTWGPELELRDPASDAS